MKAISLGIALFVMTTIGGQAMAQDAETEIRAAAHVFVETFNNSDGNTLAAMYTEDAVLLPPGGERVEGIAAIGKFWQQAMDSGLKLESLDVDEVTEDGDQAVDIGRLTITAPDGSGGTTTINAKYIVIWKRGADGVWLMHRDMWNTH